MSTQPTVKTPILDPTFGEGGKLDIRPPGNFRNELFNLTHDATNRLFAYGRCRVQDPDEDQAGVCRLLDDGKFDTAFGEEGNGFITIPHDRTLLAHDASSIAFISNGDVLITGAKNRYSKLTVIRYDSTGKNPKVHDFGPADEKVFPILLMLDNKLLLATGYNREGLLYRLLEDGRLDPDFGENGKFVFMTARSLIDSFQVVASDSPALFYVACRAGTGFDGFILRIKNEGALDTDFAENGIYATQVDGSLYSYCQRLVHLGDGKLLVLIAGFFSDLTTNSYVIRLTADGKIDRTFNRGQPIEVVGADPEDLAVQADGKFLVTLRSMIEGSQLRRYLPDGLPDADFGTDGVLPIAFDEGTTAFVRKVAVQADGKVLVSGMSGSGTVLLRYLPS